MGAPLVLGDIWSRMFGCGDAALGVAGEHSHPPSLASTRILRSKLPQPAFHGISSDGT
jgi:hypothetical protein